jgi:hypothetical protein
MIHTIHPYLSPDGLLVFDAPEHGLVEEPFVNGADEIIMRAVEEQGIPDPGAGFELRFSDKPFDAPLHDVYVLRWTRAETIGGLAGNWYRLLDSYFSGWLCPALLCYYEEPPAWLYFQVAPLPAKAERRMAAPYLVMDDRAPGGWAPTDRETVAALLVESGFAAMLLVEEEAGP